MLEFMRDNCRKRTICGISIYCKMVVSNLREREQNFEKDQTYFLYTDMPVPACRHCGRPDPQGIRRICNVHKR